MDVSKTEETLARFIEDKPAKIESNKFDAHRLISNAIVDDIRSGSKASRRIAIVGSWGSGKSTTVNYIERSLSDEKDAVFVNFDLWSHTGDALRRSFLYCVYQSIDKMTDKDELDEKKEKRWEKIKTKIEYEEQAVLTLERQDLSPIAIFAALLIALYAALGALCAAVEPFLPQGAAPFIPVAQLGFTLLVCVIYRLASKTPLFKSKKDNLSLIARLGTGIREVVKHLGGKPDIKRTRTTQTEVLGTIAFEEYLDEMLQTSKEINPHIKLILVFDNLDRLKEDKIEEAWNGIQVFSSYLNSEKNPVDTWLILPISDKTIASISVESSNADGALSKLFIVRYVIPQPIRSDWKTLVFSYLEQAFPQITADEKLYSFECINISDISEKRTPRSCISFINDMVAELHMFAGIGIENVAAFVFLRREHKSDEETFESKMTRLLADGLCFDELPKDLPNEISLDALAMMTYGVDNAEKAQEVFLKTLFSDLKNIESLQLDEMCNKNKGIWNGIREYVSLEFSEEVDVHDDRLDALITKIANFEPTDDESAFEKTETLISLIPMIEKSNWPFRDEMGQCIIDILEASNYSEQIKKQISISLRRTSVMLRDDSERNRIWLLESARVLNDLNAHERSLDSVEIKPQGSIYDLFKLIADLDIPQSVFGQFDFSVNDIQKVVLDEIIEKRPTLSSSGIKTLKIIGESRIYDDQSDSNIKSLVANMRLTQAQHVTLFISLWWIAAQVDCSPVEEFLQEQITNQRLDGYLYDIQLSVYGLAASIGYYIATDFHSGSLPDHSTFFSRQQDNINEEVVRLYLFEASDELNQQRVDDVFSNSNLQDNLLLHMAKLAVFDVEAHIPFEQVIELYKILDDGDRDRLENNLLRNYTSTEVREVPFNALLSGFYGNIRDLANDEDFDNWLKEGILLLDSDYWIDQLESPYSSKAIALTRNLFGEDGLPESLNEAVLGLLNRHSLKGAIEILEKDDLISALSSNTFKEYSALLATDFRDGNGRTWITYEPLNKRMWINDMTVDDAASTYREIVKINTNAGAQCLAIQSKGLKSFDKKSLLLLMEILETEVKKSKIHPQEVLPNLEKALLSITELSK